MKKIVDDFNKCLPKIIEAGVILADGLGENEAEITYNKVYFNGKTKCGHPLNNTLIIPWPTDNAGGIVNPYTEDAQKGNWFAGAQIEKRMCNGTCDYEAFLFERVISKAYEQPDEKQKDLLSEFCKTAFRPYDLAVIMFLIIAKHHLKNDIKVSSDGTETQWYDGKFLCHKVLGYGLDFTQDEDL